MTVKRERTGVKLHLRIQLIELNDRYAFND